MKLDFTSSEIHGVTSNGRVTGVMTQTAGQHLLSKKQVGQMKMMVHSSCVKRISRSTLVESNSAVSTIITSMRSSRPVISLTPSLSFVSRSQHQVAMPISPLIRPMIDALIVMSTMTTLTSGLLLLELKILMRRKRNSSTRMESRDRIVIFGKNTKT